MSRQIPSHDQWFTRVCWSGSVGNLALREMIGGSVSTSLDGGLISGLGEHGPKLSSSLLQSHFKRHASLRRSSRLDRGCATALVSVSDRIIDTVQRAFSKYYDCELPEDIHIVFIQVPADKRQFTGPHSAQGIAEDCGFEDSDKFKHEFVFEWAIPAEFISHTVTVKTLLDRGLSMDKYLTGDGQLLSTSQLRCAMAETYFGDDCLWEIGLDLGYFAMYFGARSPLGWIAEQLLWDIAGRRKDDSGNPPFVWISFPQRKSLKLGSSCLEAIDDGIRTRLFEWWLLDDDFLAGLEEYECERDRLENCPIDTCTDFFLRWKCVDKESMAFIQAHTALERELKGLDNKLEASAIEIGL